MKVDNIKSEAYFYCYTFDGKYRLSPAYIFPKKILFYMSEAYNLQKSLGIDIHFLINDINNTDKIADRFKFQINDITNEYKKYIIKKYRLGKVRLTNLVMLNDKGKEYLYLQHLRYGDKFRIRFKDYHFNLNIKIYEIKFPLSLIGLLSQIKFFDKERDSKLYEEEKISMEQYDELAELQFKMNLYLKFLNELTKNNGLSFDEYITNWAKSLLQQSSLNINTFK